MDNLRDTIQNVTKTAYKATKGFVKSTKLSLELSSEESRLKSIYIDIGKKVHEIYSYGGSLGKFFDEKYAEMLDCEQKIDSLKKEVDKVRGNRTCPKCSKTSAFTSEFCPKCGTNLDAGEPVVAEPPPIPAAPEPEPVVSTAVNAKNCQICGKENAVENKFCFSCGRIL